MTNYTDIIGSRIRILRKYRKLSQKELAEAIGHSSSSFISFLERGQRNISLQQLYNICNVLCCSVESMVALHHDITKLLPQSTNE